MQFVPKENGTPIRQPSTANLMIDSADRGDDSLGYLLGSANNFQIARSNSILNGFFTRVGTTEIVLEWQTPNFSPTGATDTVTINYTAPSVVPFSGNVPSGFYTQAQLVDLLARYLNIVGAATTPATTWTVETTPSSSSLATYVRLVPDQIVTVEIGGTLGTRLRINPAPQVVDPTLGGLRIFAADLRLYRFLDFVSTQLTYNQALKDASTAQNVRDVLARWYFAFDQPAFEDQYGFPILMGYTPFVLRRTFSPPKQIRWESNIPIGNLSFQVYQPNGELALMTDAPGSQLATPPNLGTNWLMTLQVSEV